MIGCPTGMLSPNEVEIGKPFMAANGRRRKPRLSISQAAEIQISGT
jgi:hypothetical protein